MELYYIVARDTETGTWFTTGETYTPEGSVYDDETGVWKYVDDCDVRIQRYERESHEELSAALDRMNMGVRL